MVDDPLRDYRADARKLIEFGRAGPVEVDRSFARSTFSFDLGCVLTPSPAPSGTYGDEPVDDLEEALKFERGSNLIVMSGYPTNERDQADPKAGLYYYEWTGTALRLVKFEQKNEGC